MDLNSLLANLGQGNNWIILLLALFLFKDQLIAFITKKPVVPTPPPVVDPNPPAPVITIPTNHPLIDTLVKDVLPILLPLLVNVLKKNAEPPK